MKESGKKRVFLLLKRSLEYPQSGAYALNCSISVSKIRSTEIFSAKLKPKENAIH